MALVRGKYGVEYTPPPVDEDSNGLARVLVVVAIVALISLVWSLVARHRAASAERAAAAPPAPEKTIAVLAPELPPAPEPEPEVLPAAPAKPPPRTLNADALVRRPPNVRNLLMRLDEAERRRDVEMAISTIEQIRALPGAPAADLDDALARRLGTLNVRRLFVLKSPQWVKEVTVRRGDSASRIASEHGATLASLGLLNGGKIDRITVGQRLTVLNHPRFALVIHRRARTADLQLNGKFFKRYDLTGPVRGADGPYEMSVPARTLWKTLGVELKAQDRTELETLMPKGAPVLVAEV